MRIRTHSLSNPYKDPDCLFVLSQHQVKDTKRSKTNFYFLFIFSSVRFSEGIVRFYYMNLLKQYSLCSPVEMVYFSTLGDTTAKRHFSLLFSGTGKRPDSPVSSCLSFKSDQSMPRSIHFNENTASQERYCYCFLLLILIWLIVSLMEIKFYTEFKIASSSSSCLATELWSVII